MVGTILVYNNNVTRGIHGNRDTWIQEYKDTVIQRYRQTQGKDIHIFSVKY